MKKKTKLVILSVFLVVLGATAAIYSVYTVYSANSKPQKIKQIKEEISVLEQIKEAVTEKYLPVYSDRRMILADSIYAADGNSYEEALQKANKQALQKPDELYKSVEKCEPCLYIQSLILKKTMELNELEKN